MYLFFIKLKYIIIKNCFIYNNTYFIMTLLKVIKTMIQKSYMNNQMPTQFGRWCMPNNPKYFQKATLIMDRSNEDHCGGCGNNLLIKNYQQDSVINNGINNEIDKYLEGEIYYYPYTM